MKKMVGLSATASVIALHGGIVAAQVPPPSPSASQPAAAASSPQQLDAVVITGSALGKGEARANSVVDRATLQEQPAGLDPLKLVNRVAGLQVSSSDALTGSFSMRLSMRGLNKEQIGISVDGIPNGSTLSNGGTLPNRLLDPANLLRIDVSQTAGDIGTPSNQALGGFIDFKTRDPSRTAGGEVEVSLGNYGYNRQFFRYDTGEFGRGTRAYVDASHAYVRTWPGDQSGRSERKHADLRVLQDFGNGNSLRGTLSYNDLADNDYDAVALRALSAPFYKANFETNPNTDGLTDAWTGNPALDQNNRRTRGINSTEWFAHLDGTVRFGETGKLTLNPYYHHQEGEGWFYVPYKQVPANGVIYSAAADTGGRPVATAQECFANQYQRDANGALIPVAAVTFPSGVTAATLAGLGCPAAARYAMNPQNTWGAREASRRKGGYEMDRTGTLSEISATFGDIHDVRAGGWYEHISRAKTRNWYLATNPAVDYSYDDSALYSVTQDRKYRSNTAMAYVQDRMHLLDDKVELDVGVTYQRFSETYRSPVEFSGERALAVSSGLLPKVAALYRLTDNVEIFASGSKNFSAIPDSVFEGTSAVPNAGIKPETSTNIDGGVRWTSGKSGFAVQVYSIKYRDRISIQNGQPDGDIFSRDTTTTFLNQGGISSRGIELTGQTSLASFDFYANYAYNDAHYTADTPAEGIVAGDPVLGAARHNAFAEVTWRPIGALRVTTNVKYVGKAAGTYDVVSNGTAARPIVAGGPLTYPREYMPAYALVGVSASYKLGASFGALKGIELGFNVDNLFNKRYLGGVGAELTTSNPLTSGRYFLGSPRTLFFTLRAQV